MRRRVDTSDGIELAELRHRIEAAEARNIAGLVYRGVWAVDTNYAQNELTTHEGSIWIATRDTDAKPGTGSNEETGWCLCVKRGEAGESAFRLAKRKGFKGDEREWLASLHPQPTGTA